MEQSSDVLEMQSTECDYNSNCVIVFGDWTINELILTPERARWLWRDLRQYPTLFTDMTRDDPNNLFNLLASPNSFWLEARYNGNVVGILYALHIQPGIDADVHVIFFDRKVADKVDISRMVVQWFMSQFHLHRVTTMVPDIYFSTKRLARRVGFREEGVRKEVYLMNGRWVDEIIFGLLASEV